jgi:hypothetical protein
MDRTQKIDCGTNGEVIFTGATIKFQLKEGLTLRHALCGFSFTLVGVARASNCFSRRFKSGPERWLEYLRYALCAMLLYGHAVLGPSELRGTTNHESRF